jgi:hypothetical protein
MTASCKISKEQACCRIVCLIAMSILIADTQTMPRRFMGNLIFSRNCICAENWTHQCVGGIQACGHNSKAIKDLEYSFWMSSAFAAFRQMEYVERRRAARRQETIELRTLHHHCAPRPPQYSPTLGPRQPTAHCICSGVNVGEAELHADSKLASVDNMSASVAISRNLHLNVIIMATLRRAASVPYLPSPLLSCLGSSSRQANYTADLS